jgi:hypothetical protein
MVAIQDLPPSFRPPFYLRLNPLLDEAGFERYVENLCRPYKENFGRSCKREFGHLSHGVMLHG